MFTRWLSKLFLACTIVTLVLFILISETFTAFADSHVSIHDAVATDCLDVSASTGFGELAPSTSPPGQQVQFSLVLSVTNRCSSAVTTTSFSTVAHVVCPEGTVLPTSQTTVPIPFSATIAPGKETGPSRPLTGSTSCVYLVDNKPVASTAPVSISIDLQAFGTQDNGQPVDSPVDTFPVKW